LKLGRYGTNDDDWKDFTPQEREPRQRLRLLTPQKELRQSATDIKTKIKAMILANPNISPREIEARVKGVSLITISAIRSEFRHTLTFLRERGLLK
jgi:hypothetical protein